MPRSGLSYSPPASFATLTIIARVEGRRLLGQPGRRLELVATLALIAAVSTTVFWQSRFALPFLVLPPLMLCVFRHRFGGFVLGTAIIAVIATMGTTAGHGLFMLVSDASATQRTLMLQLFILSVCLIGFPMAVVLTERKLFGHRIAESERNYRLLADNTSDLIGRIGSDDKRFYISPSVTAVLGWKHEDFDVPRWDLVHPDDSANLRRIFNGVLETGEDAAALCRMRHRDGHYPWIEFKFSRMPGEREDDPLEIIFAGRDVTWRVEAERELERLARRDPLTGLPNRLHFNERVALAIARNQRHGKPLALLYLDIDHFKKINDSRGHGVGDEVLKEFSRRLAHCVRATDFAARLGGDEFVVLAEDIDTPDAPQAIAEKLSAQMREDMIAGDLPLRVSTSIGIALCAHAVSGTDELMQLADNALYAAKAAGRNTWRMA